MRMESGITISRSSLTAQGSVSKGGFQVPLRIESAAEVSARYPSSVSRGAVIDEVFSN